MKSLIILNLIFGCTTPDSNETKPEKTVETERSIKRTKAQKDADFEKEQFEREAFRKAFFDQAPEIGKKLLPLLSAHHLDDLPSKQILDRQENAELGLVWIAKSEHNIGIRSRAIHLLHFYSSAETTEFLISVAGNDSENYLLRSAALSSIATWSLEKRTEQTELLSKTLEAKNPVVVVNAIQAASSIEGLQQKIKKLQENHPSKLVREAKN